MGASAIAAGTRTPQINPLGGTNPLEMMNTMMDLRNKQMQFNANIDAGQRYAAAGTPEEALRSLQTSPYAAYQIGLANQIREGMLTAQRITQSQAETGLAGAQTQKVGIEAGRAQYQTDWEKVQNAVRMAHDQQSFQEAMAGVTPTLSPENKHLADDISKSIWDNDPATFTKNLTGWRMSNGMGAADAAALAVGGIPTTQTIAGQPTTGYIPFGQPGAVYPGLTPGTGSGLQLPGQPQGVPELGAGTTVPPAAGGPPTGEGPGTAAAPAPERTPLSQAAGNDYLGQPLYTGKEVSPVKIPIHPQTGMPVLSPAQQKTDDELTSDLHGPAYADAQQAQAALDRMDGAYDNLARGGGFLKAGPSEGFRAEVAGLANTWAEIAGKEPPFDPSKIASTQEFVKEATRLTGQVTNQFFGASRHAAETITQMGKAVPSIENTTLAGKAIIQTLRASTAWNIDLHNFENAWLADHKTLIGAPEAFAMTHKPADYATKAMADLGLKPGGEFMNIQAVANATQKGWLTWAQGRMLAHEQFNAPLPKELEGKSWADIEDK